MKSRIILYLTLLSCLFSCVDEYNAALPLNDQKLLVVEGNIVSDQLCTFYLTHTVPINDNHQDYRVSGADVKVCGTDGSTWNAKSRQTNQYQVNVGKLNNDVQYWLEIRLLDGTTYSTLPTTPSQAPEIRLTTYKNDQDPNPSMEVRLEVTDSRQPMHLRLSYQEWWEIKTPERSQYVTATEWVGDHYETFLQNHGYGTFTNKEDIFLNTEDFTDCHVRDFPVYSRVITSPKLSKLYYSQVTCQAVSEEEFRYEEARRKQSDEMGGLFTPQPGNLPSNIRCTSNSNCRALGFVGVRGSISKQSLWVSPEEIGWYEVRKYEIKSAFPGSKDDMLLQEDVNYRLWMIDRLTGEHYWTSTWRVDFTDSTWGGQTHIAPDFWPKSN